MTEKWPKHLGPKRAFQRRKRREALKLQQALRDFRFGSMYLPEWMELQQVFRGWERVLTACRVWWKNA